MAECRRVFSDATQSSPSGCKKLGKHGSRKRAVRRWALENDEKKQQNSHGLFQRKYAWNEKNLLKESSDSRHTVFYRYGADGQRALKSSEQSETLYFNTMWSWIHNRSAYNTDREIKHIYLGSERLVTRTNGAGSDGHTSTAEASTYYYHSDHLGSAHLITDYKGDEYERVEYTPYGEYWIEKRAPENKTLPFKFTGKERDEETGLYYYGARYLDAKTSRWLTADPALGEYIPMAPVNDEAKKHNQNLPGMGGIYNTVNMHLYHYAGNNPVKYTDPDGRFSICDYYVPDLLLPTKTSTKVLGIPLGGGLSSTQKEIKKIHDLIFVGASQIPNVGSFASAFTAKSFVDGVKLVSGIISKTAGTILTVVDLLAAISADPDIQAYNYTSDQQELLAMYAIEQSFTKDFSQALEKKGFYNKQETSGAFIKNLEIIVSNYFTDKEILLKIANEVKNSNPLYEKVQIQLGE